MGANKDYIGSSTIFNPNFLFMTKPPLAGFKPVLAFFLSLLFFNVAQAQPTKHIDWASDTVSKADAIGGKNTYVNTVRGSGQLATEMIKLPVNKMKEIFDACAAHNISEVAVMIVSIRQADLARFRKNNPEIQATYSQLKGRQMLVFRVPRSAFASAAGAQINLSKTNPLIISLMGAGLMMLDASYLDIPAGSDDIYFSVGTICPPPASCDF